MDPDADHVTRRNRVRLELLERLVDDQRNAEALGGCSGQHVEPSRSDDRRTEERSLDSRDVCARSNPQKDSSDTFAQSAEEPRRRHTGLLRTLAGGDAGVCGCGPWGNALGVRYLQRCAGRRCVRRDRFDRCLDSFCLGRVRLREDWPRLESVDSLSGWRVRGRRGVRERLPDRCD